MLGVERAELTQCPKCGHPLTKPQEGYSWCPACEWQLDEGLKEPGQRVAFRLDKAMFNQFADRPPGRPGWTSSSVVLTVIAIVLWLLVLSAFIGGIWLVVATFPSVLVLLGLALIGLALLVRPRLGRSPQKRLLLNRDSAPTLFSLVDRVAVAAGAPIPEHIVVDPDYNASYGRVGLRQTAVLQIGIPLWIILTPGMRVALLAHELGHRVNGDPTRGLIVRPALTTFAELADWTGANISLHSILVRGHNTAPIEVVVWLISRIFLGVHLGLTALGMRDHQRSEYMADGISSKVAGSRSAAQLLDWLTLLPEIAIALAYNADTVPPKRWRDLGEKIAASRGAALPELRQLSRRQTSLWSSHPPSGLRSQMIAAWPQYDPQVHLSDEDSAQIDSELSAWYAATHRKLLGTREYSESGIPPPAIASRTD